MIGKDEILGRIEAGRTYMRGLAAKAERHAARYRELGGRKWFGEDGSGLSMTQPLGQINYPAINTRQKVSATAYSAPDFAVRGPGSEESEAVRQALIASWRERRYLRVTRHALMARILSGMGFVAYLWDTRDGFVLEHVSAKDMFADPHTIDATWNSLRWAGRRITLPGWVAEQRYPGIMDRAGKTGMDAQSDRSDAIRIDVYWDPETEAEVWDGEILDRRPNPYGRVPIVALQGDINPDLTSGGEFALGDYDQVTGAAEMLRRMQDIMNNAAQHGGGYAWVDGAVLDPASREALLSGNYSRPVVLNGSTGDKAIGWTAIQPVNPALLEGMRYISSGIDADMGVTQYQRGVLQHSAKFATEAMMLQSASGVRGAEARTEFEQFCSELAEAQVRLVAEFGDPYAMPPGLWRAFTQVESVRVVEESASWRDPAMEQQSSMQLLNTVSSLMPTFLQMAQMGLLSHVPNLVPLLNDVYRAFKRRELETYWLPVEPAAAADPAAGGAPTEGPQPAPGAGMETVNAG